MKTHENRALFSRAFLKATNCLFLTARAGVSSVCAAPETTESMSTAMVQQQTVTVSGVVKDKKGEPIIGANIICLLYTSTVGLVLSFQTEHNRAPFYSQFAMIILYLAVSYTHLYMFGEWHCNFYYIIFFPLPGRYYRV